MQTPVAVGTLSGGTSVREGKERTDGADGLATPSGTIVVVRKGQAKVTAGQLVHR